MPSEKAKRYDRQLRLWGDHGQRSLENAHVCLINASATGTEILKNLVLPGMGAFTIVDRKTVSEADLGSNFFLSSDALGKSRAKIAVEHLLELNSEVRGDYIEDDFDSLLSINADFFQAFSIVIATELPEEGLLRLAQVLWKSATPLLVARSYGLLGYIRIAFPRHEVIEAHPDNSHEDLRLDSPFPGLVTYMDGIDLDSCDNSKHCNVPYLVVLYKYIQKWREGHNGENPKNYREKKEFKEMIQGGVRINEDGVPLDEDNFHEAIQNVNATFVPTQIPLNVQQIFDDQSCTHISSESNNFWLLSRAVKEFVSNEGGGKLPLRGSIPDMTSSSNLYVELQRAYQTQARKDMEHVAGHLGQLLVSVSKPPNFVPEDSLKLFCRNSAFLRVILYRSLEKEQQSPNTDVLRRHLDNPDSELVYYVLLKSAEQFFSVFKFFPGEKDGAFESDVAQMKVNVCNLLQKWGLSMYTIHDDHIIEFCRYGGSEIHSIAAYVGGVASQEVVKIITKQYLPLNNTYIYNAAQCTSLCVEL